MPLTRAPNKSEHKSERRTEQVWRALGDREAVLAGVLGAALGVVVFWLMHRALGDDALITVSFARTLAESGTWGVYPGLTSNTQTSPLNAWLLAAGIAVAGHPLLVVGAVLCACLAACGWLATDIARRLDVHPAAGWLAVGLLGTSPVLVSTVGLETYLGIAVLLGVAAAAVRGRVALTGVLCGLAVLTRPDLAVPAAVIALFVALPPDRTLGPMRRMMKLSAVAGVAALVALPWHLWSWFALGGAVPDTTWVRTADRSGPTILPAVPGWVQMYPVAAIASALPVVAGLGCAAWAARRAGRRWAQAVLLFVGAGWAHLLALAAIDAQGAGWYYGPVVACSSAALAIAAAATGPRAPRASVVLVGGLAAIGVLAAGPAPWTWSPLVANLARTEQYAAIAQQLPALTGGQPVLGPGEVGALAFYGTVPVLDFLTEPALTDVVLRDRAGEGGMRAAVMTWSAAHRDLSTPLPVRWQLTFASGDRSPPGRVVRTWPIDTPVRGRDTLVLTEIG